REFLRADHDRHGVTDGKRPRRNHRGRLSCGQGNRSRRPGTGADFAGKHVRLAKEIRHEGCRRRVVYLFRCADLLNGTGIHDHYAVRHGQRLFLVVRNEDGGNAGLALDFLDLDAHFLPHIGIEGRKRLVKEKHLRLENNGTREGNALLLPARKLRGQLLLAAGKPDHFQGPAKLAGNLGLGYVAVFQPERDIVENILVWKQSIALEDQPDIALVDRHVVNAPPADRNPALGDVDQARDRAQNGGFAASRGPEKRDETSRCDCEGKIPYRNELAIGDLDIAKLDRRLRRTVS